MIRGGSGEEEVTCAACKGSGIEAYVDEPTNDDRVVQKSPMPCSECGGSGFVSPLHQEKFREAQALKAREAQEE